MAILTKFRWYPHLELNRSSAKFIKIAILAEFVKIAALSVPLSRAHSLFGEILSKSPFSLNSSKSPLCWYRYLELNRSLAKFRQNQHSRRIRRDSSKSPLRRYPHLELNRSSAKFVKIAILTEFAGFVKIATLSVPLSGAQSIFSEISSNLPFSPNSPDSSKSPLCRYPYLELNPSLAKFCQNRHSRRIR